MRSLIVFISVVSIRVDNSRQEVLNSSGATEMVLGKMLSNVDEGEPFSCFHARMLKDSDIYVFNICLRHCVVTYVSYLIDQFLSRRCG
jgi:hypothetical protein